MALPNFLICFLGVMKSSVKVCMLCYARSACTVFSLHGAEGVLNVECVKITGFSGGGALL